MIPQEEIIEYLKNKFYEDYSYICVEDNILENVIKQILAKQEDDSDDIFLDKVKDYILSQGLEEEVTE